MSINWGNIKKARDWFEAEVSEELVDMEDWFKDLMVEEALDLFDNPKSCDTSACFVGWSMLNKEFNPDCDYTQQPTDSTPANKFSFDFFGIVFQDRVFDYLFGPSWSKVIKKSQKRDVIDRIDYLLGLHDEGQSDEFIYSMAEAEYFEQFGLQD